ncbi:MAG TPA: hypothetical protein VGC72_15945 [Candidatus Elarobacter sp.]|jgi:hypothetical protein
MNDDDNAQTAPPSADEKAAQDAFERGLLERGEAAPLDKDGRLPPDATHEIVPDDEGGESRIERRRFKLF